MLLSVVTILFLLIFVVGGIALFVWWVMMLVEALRIPSQQWEAAGHNQVIYVVAMIFLGIIGTFLYMLIPRKDLRIPAGV